MLRRDSKRIWCGFTNSCFHGRTPMESISTTSSLSSQRTNSGKAKSSIFQQRILMVRHGTEWSQLPVSSSLKPEECHFFFFFLLLRSTADTSPHQTSPQAVAESADERSSQRETGNHPQECHLGRYTHGPERIFAIIKNPHLPYLVFTVRPGQAEEVFTNMAGDFMRPVVDVVDQLLSAGVNVTVYNGQLDLIVDTMGVHRRPHEQRCC